MNAERLAELFADAIEREPAGRRQLVSEIAAADPDLAAELERLLAAAGDSSPLDRSPWIDVGAGDSDTDMGVAGPAPLPERIGPYRVVCELGRGGMGRVFLAIEETEHFRRNVAVKVLDRSASDAVAVRRFRDEVRILASLEHPGIARFLDGGRAPDGSWFLALEHVEGEDLIAHAASRQLTVRGRVELFVAIVDAVEFAHRNGVVHRDLKPANLLVGSDGRPRLLDFGISKLVDPDDEEAVTLTRIGMRALTPAYASPEQFRGDPVTRATDVYALGSCSTSYSLGGGRSTPPAPRPLHSSMPSSKRTLSRPARLRDAPIPPRRWPGGIPSSRPRRGSASPGRATSTATSTPSVSRRCASDPEERYPTAGDLAADLRRWLEGQPVVARRGGLRYRVARLAHRYRGRLTTAAALSLTAAAVIVAATAYRRAERLLPPEAPAPQIFPFSNMDPATIEELQRAFAAAPDSVESGAALALRLIDTDRPQEAALVVARLRQIPGREHDPLTDYVDGSIALDTEEPQRALVLLTRARAGALASGRGELFAQVCATRGRLLTTLGQRDEGQAEMELARREFERAGDHASLARVLNDLAIERLQRGEMESGEALLEEAAAATRAAGRRPVVILEPGPVGDGARAAGSRRSEVSRGVGDSTWVGEAGADRTDAVRGRRCAHDLGQPHQARELAEEAIALLRPANEPVGLAEALLARSMIDLDALRLDDIDATAKEIEDAAGSVGRSVELAYAWHLRGRAAAARGDLAGARHQLAAARDLLVESGDLDFATGVALELAAIEHDAGNPEAALQLLDSALARLDAGTRHGVAFVADTLRARIAAEAGAVNEARRGSRRWATTRPHRRASAAACRSSQRARRWRARKVVTRTPAAISKKRCGW